MIINYQKLLSIQFPTIKHEATASIQNLQAGLDPDYLDYLTNHVWLNKLEQWLKQKSWTLSGDSPGVWGGGFVQEIAKGGRSGRFFSSHFYIESILSSLSLQHFTESYHISHMPKCDISSWHWNIKSVSDQVSQITSQHVISYHIIFKTSQQQYFQNIAQGTHLHDVLHDIKRHNSFNMLLDIEVNKSL